MACDCAASERRHPVVLIPGTWGWGGPDDPEVRWHSAGSAFRRMLIRRGWDPHTFVWSTRLSGACWQKKRRLDWQAAGAHLAEYLDPSRPRYGVDRAAVVISHSHGLQVVLEACGRYGARIPVLIDVCGPVRRDMRAITENARPNIGAWMHLYADWSDKMQILGQLFDGAVGIVRQHPLADLNTDINGSGHSGVLNDEARYALWESEGWLTWMHSAFHAGGGR